jgi:hypothetical protein
MAHQTGTAKRIDTCLCRAGQRFSVYVALQEKAVQ